MQRPAQSQMHRGGDELANKLNNYPSSPNIQNSGDK